jgi:hypothetical protein
LKRIKFNLPALKAACWLRPAIEDGNPIIEIVRYGTLLAARASAAFWDTFDELEYERDFSSGTIEGSFIVVFSSWGDKFDKARKWLE